MAVSCFQSSRNDAFYSLVLYVNMKQESRTILVYKNDYFFKDDFIYFMYVSAVSAQKKAKMFVSQHVVAGN